VLAAVAHRGEALASAAEELRSDEDFVLLCVRSCWNVEEANFCYLKANDIVKKARSRNELFRAKHSRLAVRGQTKAPVLSVILKEVHDESGQTVVQAEGTLASGRTISCRLPSTHRSEPAVNDLAAELLEELWRELKMDVTHVFINLKNSHDEWEVVTVWDHARQLKDFPLSHGA